MVKKTLLGVGVLLVAGAVVFGTDMLSYAGTACSNIQEAVKSEITPEFELSRINNEIDKLMPEIRQHMAVVAEQTVDVKDLEKGIAERQAKLDTQKDAILALRSDLETDADSFTYRAVSYSRGEVKTDLSRRFDAFRTGEEALKRDRKILESQRQILDANQKKLDSMLGRKEELAVKVVQLEARLKTIQATEAVNAIEVDDTKLSHVESMISDLNHELDVRESMLETEGSVLGHIPVEESHIDVEGDVVNEIDQHFGLNPEPVVAEN
ncbi:MAG TPA: hypothetical protein DCG12_18285 [Planctomycetaceae bacterium]|nr:hypothetical protein [Planctomycetaceae bacterium]